MPPTIEPGAPPTPNIAPARTTSATSVGDASWLAYIAHDGLVVQRFSGTGSHITVAGGGAAQPRWSIDGRQLFFISADKKLMAVDFDPVTASAGAPRLLAQTRIVGAAFVGHQYDVAPNNRFVVSVTTSDAAPLTLMSGWTSRLGTPATR